MRDKSPDRGNKMSVTSISDPIWLGEQAKRMSEDLLRKEHRGPGDTIEAAASRIGNRHNTDPAIFMQCWNRPPREMKVSRWMSVFATYWAEFGEKTNAAYEEKREKTHAHPAIVRLADFVSGRTPHEETRAAGN